MVDSQIISRGVKNKLVIEAMKKVPREEFVLKEYYQYAFEDGPLPIGEGQTISQPYIVAFMTELLDLKGGEKVLEIGTGSGYQAAILAEIAKEVYTIEIINELSIKAQEILKKLNYKNIYFKVGDGWDGWQEKAPFDAIMITAASKKIPPKLVEQLKIEGILVLPVGTFFQELQVIKKTQKGIKILKNLPVRFVPMTGKAESET